MFIDIGAISEEEAKNSASVRRFCNPGMRFYRHEKRKVFDGESVG